MPGPDIMPAGTGAACSGGGPERPAGRGPAQALSAKATAPTSSSEVRRWWPNTTRCLLWVVLASDLALHRQQRRSVKRPTPAARQRGSEAVVIQRARRAEVA